MATVSDSVDAVVSAPSLAAQTGAGRQLMAGWLDKLLGDLPGRPRKVDKAVPSTSIPMFADWLPYRQLRSEDRALL